jgi:hypothetical protein
MRPISITAQQTCLQPVLAIEQTPPAAPVRFRIARAPAAAWPQGVQGEPERCWQDRTPKSGTHLHYNPPGKPSLPQSARLITVPLASDAWEQLTISDQWF